MNDAPQLSTVCTLKGKQYYLHMTTNKSHLTLTMTNKNTLEKWKCKSTTEFIEAMTRKTGNFKTFAVFSDMMKAVFLKTSGSLSLEIMSQVDLEKLNDGVAQWSHDHNVRHRMYVILVYTSEFDRIHYPLPLDYCGMPHPEILQATIHSLESDKCRLQRELDEVKSHSMSDKASEFGVLKKKINEVLKSVQSLENRLNITCSEIQEMKKSTNEELERFRKELSNHVYNNDCKINEMSLEVENLRDFFLKSLPSNARTKTSLISPKRNVTIPNKKSARACSCKPTETPSASSLPSRAPSPSLRRTPSLNSLASSSSGSKISRTSYGKKPSSVELPPQFDLQSADNLSKQIESLYKAVTRLNCNFSNECTRN